MSQDRSVADVKAHLSSCLKAVEAGEEVVITRHGKPIAVLVGATEWARRRDASAGGLLSLIGDAGADAGADGNAFADDMAQRVRERSAGRPLPTWD